MKFKCPCCGNYTFEGEPGFQIEEFAFSFCGVCAWMYDPVAHDCWDTNIGGNHISLQDARENYKNHGCSKEKMKEFCRLPRENELPKNNE